MTPKEKAQELFDKIYNMSGLTKESKQIALMSVDEILSVIHPTPYNVYYWQEVKKEIELL